MSAGQGTMTSANTSPSSVLKKGSVLIVQSAPGYMPAIKVSLSGLDRFVLYILVGPLVSLEGLLYYPLRQMPS